MKISSVGAAIVVRQPPASSPPARGETPVSEEKVTLSSEGKAKSAQDLQAAMLHKNIYGDPTLDDRVGLQYKKLGDQAFMPIGPPQHYTSEQAERFARSVEFMADVSRSRYPENNPFAGLSRSELAAIQEDSENYTEIERATAGRAKWTADQNYFRSVWELSDLVGDERVSAKGYLEYLDNLTPAERLTYPSDEHERVAAWVARLEQQHGSLPPELSLWDLMDWDPKGRLAAETLLTPPTPTEPAPSPEADSALDQGSSRVR